MKPEFEKQQFVRATQLDYLLPYLNRSTFILYLNKGRLDEELKVQRFGTEKVKNRYVAVADVKAYEISHVCMSHDEFTARYIPVSKLHYLFPYLATSSFKRICNMSNSRLEELLPVHKFGLSGSKHKYVAVEDLRAYEKKNGIVKPENV